MKLNLVGSTSYKKLPSFIYQLHKAEFQSIQKWYYCIYLLIKVKVIILKVIDL
jgi:hypothetical protein